MSATHPPLPGLCPSDGRTSAADLSAVGPELRDVLGLSAPSVGDVPDSLFEMPGTLVEPRQLAFPSQPRLEMSSARSVMVVGPSGVGKSTLGATLLASFPGHRGWITTSRQARRFSCWSALLDQLRADLIHPLVELQLHLPSGQSSSTANGEGSLEGGPTAAGSAPSPMTSTRRVEMMRIIRGWIARLRDNRADREPTMVVIDDWGSLVNLLLDDPVASCTPPATRSAVAQLLATSLTEEGMQIVLLTEEGEDLRMGSVIDTYATLNFEEVGGRQVRTLELRGKGPVASEPRLPFLVGEGRVTLPPTFPGNAFGWDYDASVPAWTPEGLWPGSSDLAKLLGRVAPGSLTYLEFEEGVPTVALVALTAGLGLSACRAGGACLALAPPEAQAPMIGRAITESRAHPRPFSQMRFLSIDRGSELGGAEEQGFTLPFSVPKVGSDSGAPDEVSRWVSGLPAHAPKVALISTEGYLAMAEEAGAPKNLSAASRGASRLQSQHWAVVVTSSIENMARHPTALPIDRRVRLFMDEGRLFAYGTQPRTPLWSLSARPSARSRDLHLVVELAA
jgi:hypothetical protein